ncbi:hypothetical protein GPECTOR_5g60 [Gonium pectorale]|uniref:Uncharacterized protein n=1 Tax=Gonium pectorale TaxID=33097 RepID=A0A150GX75_GONPE|nr:hypothetical protein GPECTOR_5g60 [Gonium pectorale]|eukprot:KXZ54405.1 hypothetical protein GPECTOR_5g60 [Gonium pectorale]
MAFSAAGTGRVFPQLPSKLTELIARRLHPNEVATSLRLVNKAAAAQFRGPEHTTIRLWQPVPTHAFAAHWLAPGATQGFTHQRKNDLLRLTAASGVVPNLEAAVRALGWGPTLDETQAALAVHEHAARMAPERSAQWLVDHRCPVTFRRVRRSALTSAAAARQMHVCEWLLERGAGAWTPDILAEAAALLAAATGDDPNPNMLLQRFGADPRVTPDLLQFFALYHKADKCDLAALQRRVRAGGWGVTEETRRTSLLAVAAGSRTPDWAAKVEWLEAQGCPRSVWVVDWSIAYLETDEEALAHIAWLRSRGYALNAGALEAAACTGKPATLQYLLAEVPTSSLQSLKDVCSAARGGHLAALQVLHGAGWKLDGRRAALCAAEGGHLRVLEWLAETLGTAGLLLDAELFRRAAGTGSVELLAWLRERGCPWDSTAFPQAAASGCEAAVEWLMERGCPMPDPRGIYAAACRNGDLPMMRCLRRLGVSWGAFAEEFLRLPVDDNMLHRPRLAVLRWLLEAGCPVSNGAVRTSLRDDARHGVAYSAEVLQVLEQHERQQRGRWLRGAVQAVGLLGALWAVTRGSVAACSRSSGSSHH